jgi:hypothetical protein
MKSLFKKNKDMKLEQLSQKLEFEYSMKSLKLEKETEILFLNGKIEQKRDCLIKENQWLREKAQLEIENLKITEIERMKQELEMLKKTETFRVEMLERLLKEKDAEIQRLSGFIHAGKVPLIFVENPTKKKKERMPYVGEKILVSNKNNDWCIKTFTCFKNNMVCTYDPGNYCELWWDSWKFIDE